MTLFEDVGTFHTKFGLPRCGAVHPNMLDVGTFDYCVAFLLEELTEFVEAHNRGDLVKCADALADLVYIVLVTAHFMGIPFDQIWAEVQRANMQKERATGADDPRSKRGHHLDVVKPEGWRAPDHEPILVEAVIAFRRGLR